MTAALRPGLTQDKDLKACSDECPSRIFVSTDMAGLEGVPITDRDTMLEEEAVGKRGADLNCYAAKLHPILPPRWLTQGS